MRMTPSPPAATPGDRNPLDTLRQSACETMPLEIVGGSTATWGSIGASGLCLAAIAVCEAATTFTKIRFATGGTAPSGISNFRAAVWDGTTGARLMDTADFSSATPTGGTSLNTGGASYWHEWPLLNSVTLADKQQVWLGFCAIGTSGTVQFRALSAPSIVAVGGGTGVAGSPVILPAKTKVNSSYGGTSPVPALAGGPSSTRPWVQLA